MIFILGGRGLVGSAFQRLCERRQEPFVVLDRQNYTDHIGAHCDLFVNANGNSSKLLSKTDPIKDFDASVRTVRSSLNDFQYHRYLHLSSCDVYPDCSSPLTATENLEPDPARQSPYGFHKYLAEQCVRHCSKEWLIFRLGGLVGPGLKKNAVFDILAGGPLWLHPDSELQFIHTDRAAEIMLDLAQDGLSHRTLNLCGAGLIQLREILDAVGDVPVNPGSPVVRYDVSIEEISRLVELPQTRATVMDFVRSRMELRERRSDAG
jgi:nucleoside-diphosphate-sugar epimerase